MLITNPYASRANSYKVQLHSHTTRSDGSDTIAAMLAAFDAAGFDAVAITDHDAPAGPDEASADPGGHTMLFIPGIEETVTQGHINHPFALAASSETDGQGVVDDITAEGGFSVIAHPNYTAVGWIEDELIALSGASAIEVYNGVCSTFTPDSSAAEDKWDTNLTGNRRMWGVAVDDAHSVADIGRGWVQVAADDLSLASLLAALRAGNFYSTQGPTLTVALNGRTLTITTPDPATIVFKGSGGLTLSTTADTTEASITLSPTYSYVRAVITRASDGAMAWTNPVWIEATMSIEGLVGDWRVGADGYWFDALTGAKSTQSGGALTVRMRQDGRGLEALMNASCSIPSTGLDAAAGTILAVCGDPPDANTHVLFEWRKDGNNYIRMWNAGGTYGNPQDTVDNAATLYTSSKAKAAAGTYVHGFTWANGAAGNTYINSVVGTASAAATTPTGLAAVAWLGSAAGAAYYGGYASRYLIYNRVLTPLEIVEASASILPGPPDVPAYTVQGVADAVRTELATELAHLDEDVSAAKSLTADERTAIKTALEAEGGTLHTAAADAAAAKTAAESADGKLDTALEAPTGYTRVTSATYGTLRAGTVIDAYAAADTTYSTPLVPNAVAASNGSWHIDLPDGATYTLVGRLTGYQDRTQEVTVP